MNRQVKTSALIGAALDWAVAKCEYDNNRYNYGSPCFSPKTKHVYETEGLKQIGVNFAPSTDWKQGGPIIEREGMSIGMVGEYWQAHLSEFGLWCDGPAPLISAMRCYVASKLGGIVEIPEELTND